jgi:hypothetical protein
MLFVTDKENLTAYTFFNDIPINTTNEFYNNTYKFVLYNVTQEGIFKVIFTAENFTESQVIEVKNPFIDIKHNIPETIEKGESFKIQIRTFNPQNEALNADSVDVDVYDPDNSKTTLFLDKQENIFEKIFYYNKAGNYIFKIHPRKVGYETKEFSTITAVLKTKGIHPIVWVWFVSLGIWLILFLIRRLKR